LNPAVAPRRILTRHPDGQLANFAEHARSSDASSLSGPFTNDELPMPPQDGVRHNQRRHLTQDRSSEAVAVRGEPTSLRIGRSVAKLPLTAVESCVDGSLFTHVTVVPIDTLSGLGEYAVVVRLLAPLTIVTVGVVLVGAGVRIGVGVGAAVALLLPQAVRQSPARRTTLRRTDMLR
jgi:hypothetical protein